MVTSAENGGTKTRFWLKALVFRSSFLFFPFESPLKDLEDTGFQTPSGRSA